MEIKLYRNTGFNAVDIPDNIDLLEKTDSEGNRLFEVIDKDTTGHSDLEYYNIIQQAWLASIDINISLGEIHDVDYVTIEDSLSGTTGIKMAYTVMSYEGIAPNVFRLHLLLDAYNSIGGFKKGSSSPNAFMKAIAKRMTVSKADDESMIFDLPEPFQPTFRSTYDIQELEQLSESNRKLLESVTVPPIVDEDAYTGVIINGDNDLQAVVPKSRPITSTQIIFKLLDENGTEVTKTIEAGSRWWYDLNAAAKVKELIADFRNCGRDNDIVNYWEIPANYFDTSEVVWTPYDNASQSTPGGISSIKSIFIHKTKTHNVLPTGYTSQIYNKKALYGQNTTIKIFSPASGESKDFQLTDIIKTFDFSASQQTLDYYILADLRPNGCPYFTWKYFRDTYVADKLFQTVKGAPWRNLTLATEGVTYADVQRQASINTTMANEQDRSNTQLAQNIISTTAAATQMAASGAMLNGAGVAQGIGTAASAINAGLSSDLQYRQTLRAAKLEMANLEQNAVFASTTIQLGNSLFARELGLNTFYMLTSRYNNADLNSFECFLNRYGYNVGNRTITGDDLFTRNAFNFVQMEDVSLESGKGNLSLNKLACEQLKAGVRLWHKHPTPADLEAGGNQSNYG